MAYRRAAAWTLAAVASAVPTLAPAQDPAAAPEPEVIPVGAPEEAPEPAAPGVTLDDIVVTAQKRVERLQDVPISISAFDDEFLREYGVTDFRDLSLFVPNARIDANGTLPQLSIRGFNAHPLNRSFEQAIGMVVDGVAYGTSPYFQLPLFDIDRVEVLRGPQGTLHGKNAVAGVFNIATHAADDAVLTGSIGAQFGQLDRQRVEIAVGGPLVPGVVAFRAAGLFDQRDGLVENTSGDSIAGALDRTNARERGAGRLKLGMADLLGASVSLSYEKVDVELTGFGSELYIVAPKFIPYYQSYDARFDSTPGNYVSSVDARERTTVQGETGVVNVGYAFGAWEAAFVAGHSELRFTTIADPDFGPQPMLVLDQRDTHPQTTLELRLASAELPGLLGLGSLFGADLGASTLTTGVFWQSRDLADSLGRLIIDPSATALFLAVERDPATAPPAPPPGSQPDNDPSDDEIGTIYYEQTARSQAVYGQAEWRFLPSTALQLGLRYSTEQKTGDWNALTEQGTGALAFAALRREPYQARLAREEGHLSPRVLVRHEFSRDANVYLGWVRSFRGGGFNQIASTGNRDELEYDEEQVRSWEAGSKLSLLDGAARLHLGLFWMILDNYQVLSQDPTDVGFTVLNAGKARARGAEIDGRWRATDWLTLITTIGFNDSEFLDFRFGTCALGNTNTDGDADPRCDITGEPLDFAPRLEAVLSPRASWPLPWANLELAGGIVANYQGAHFLEVAMRDMRVHQEATTRWNADFGIGSRDGAWTLRIAGENLTGETVAAFKSDVPLVSNTFYQTLEPGRLLMSELTWRF